MTNRVACSPLRRGAIATGRRWAAVASVLLVGSGARQALAVPSFARQTGLPCAVCHTTFPELTAFGRDFKLNGYTLTDLAQIEAPAGARSAPLKVNQTFPLSVMLQTALTRTDKRQPDTQNNNVEFPQQLSVFFAGEITNHIGAFVQTTYTGTGDHLTLDKTDIRYANHTEIGTRFLRYGLTLNNAPSVEDLWNSTPVWGFPFAAPDSVPVPIARAEVDQLLARQVAGAGAYALWNQHLYVDTTLYRSAKIGAPQPPTAGSNENTIEDVAPYWRLAWQQNWSRTYLEVGTYGLYAKLHPDNVSGATDKFTDAAFDTQFELPCGANLLSAHATYIYESAHRDATHAAGVSNSADNLHTLQLNGIYHLRNWATLSLGYFLIRGSSDPLYAQQLATGPLNGSANGSPDSDGAIAEAAYYPWENVRLAVQYTAYTLFDGRAHDYNGTGRDAVDNNALYLLAWLVW
jgi:hypothetical protein